MKVTEGADHKRIEIKWQKRWEEKKLHQPNIKAGKNTFYNLWMFPYPSAEGLHAGHAFASTGSDIFGRFMRMKGKNVFQPIGYDSFGIHSENFAIKINQTPQKMLMRTTGYYEKQLRSLGHGYDWSRTVTTSKIEYYKWTQWLFVEMFKAGLAYKKVSSVNFCPSCKTVLADEQVMTPKQAGKETKDVDGNLVKETEDTRVCERCGTVVEKRDLDQWFFRITDYADRLLDGLPKIDWTEKVKIAQKEWIGKKEGINITYNIKDTNQKIVCFTTRPDTNFGATFIVVAPEYAKKNLLSHVSSEYKKSVELYIEKSLRKTEQQRKEEGKTKTGVFTKIYAINNLNGYEMPIYVSDFVLTSVGTGAVVGVPGHDVRDFEFAKAYDLPIKRVVTGSSGEKDAIINIDQVQEGEGKMVNSEFLNGMEVHDATAKIMDHLEEKGWGKKVFNYHLRDWLVSRQRYWGAPIPMVYCAKCAKKNESWLSKNKPKIHGDQNDWDHAGWYPEENLPVELPTLQDYKPKGNGKGPLGNHPDFYKTRCPSCKSEAKREVDVLDTFVDSAWYFLRYPSVGSSTEENLPFDPNVTKSWLPVSLYFGGAEHSVLHLMYARFVTMVLYDTKLIKFEEPFPKFYAHGLMIKDGTKMSKSKGNVVNPDKYVEKYGADTLKLYLMFMGPMDGYPDFRDTGIEGMGRFKSRVWDILTKHKNIRLDSSQNKKDLVSKMHKTIKKVTNDIEGFRYNTAIAAIMEFVNALREKVDADNSNNEPAENCQEWRDALETLVLLLAPFTPHMSEEAWVEVLGQNFSVHTHPWPKYNQRLTETDVVTMAIQIDGKIRGQVEMDIKTAKDRKKVVELSKKDSKIAKWLKGTKVKDIIFVPSKLVNFVTI